MKSKKILSVLSAAAILAASMPAVSADEYVFTEYPSDTAELISEDLFAADEDEAQTELEEITYTTGTAADFDYKVTNNTITITNYKGTYTNLRIPSTIEGRSVTRIGANAFQNNAYIRNVIIPDSVTNITQAFSGCTSLTSAVLPSKLATIGNSAFYNCTALRTITIPSTVSVIGETAFKGCSSLTSITIPSSVVNIGAQAFQSCNGLKAIEIPGTVTTIGKLAFNSCANLQSAVIHTGVPYLSSSMFKDCGNLKSVYIPSSVTKINSYAFSYCTSLDNVNIPQGTTDIGNYAFSHCESLKTLTLPKGLTYMGEYCFSYCYQLPSVTIPDGDVSTLGAYAFYQDSSLSSVTMGKGINTLGSYCFGYCEALTNVKLSPDTATIGTYAFTRNKALTQIELPQGLTQINYYSFSYSGLTEISIPSSATYIGQAAFYGCSSLRNANIAYGVLHLYSEAFYNCTSLQEIVIPGTINEVGASAFYNCSALKKAVLGNGVLSINGSAFRNCTSLEQMLIPTTVDTIGSYAFTKCDKMTIYGYADSYAQTYANSNNIPFDDIQQFAPACATITKAVGQDGRIAVNWSAVPGAAMYEVCFLENGEWCSAGTTTGLGKYVTGLTNGRKYGVAVRTYANGMWSEITSSDVVYATPESTVVKPKITKALGQDGRVAVNWTAVSGATNYAVYYTVGGKWYNAGTTTGTGMYVRNLTNGTKYGFAIKAYVNGAWTGIASSDIVYATPVASVTKPKITKAVGQDSQVALNWTAVSGASQYGVYYTVGGKWYNAGTTTGTGMYVRNLTNGTKYGFAVKAYVNGAWTAISSSDIVYATPVGTSAKPVIIKAQGQDGRVALNWTSVSGATNYAVYTYVNGKWSVAGYRTVNGMYVTGLTNGTRYGFAVKAYVNGAWTSITSSDIVYATPTASKSDVIDTDFDFSFFDENDIDFVDVAPVVR